MALPILTGSVKHGKKRGKDLGFPTANIVLSISIEEGIYISQTSIDGGNLFEQSVTFIGKPETFGETDVKAETYILDFDKDIYGKEIIVTLIKKIRDSEAFESIERLVENMNVDVQKTREYFENL